MLVCLGAGDSLIDVFVPGTIDAFTRLPFALGIVALYLSILLGPTGGRSGPRRRDDTVRCEKVNSSTSELKSGGDGSARWRRTHHRPDRERTANV